MNEKEFENILTAGEGISIEFKEAKNSLPKNVFATICAFLNSEGGKSEFIEGELFTTNVYLGIPNALKRKD